MKNLTFKQLIILYVTCTLLLGAACGIAVFKLYFREVTFISVTCKNPELSYTERLDVEGDFKCNWSSLDLNNHYVLSIGDK